MKQDTLLFDLLQSLYGLQEHAQLAQAYEYRDTARKFSSYDLLKYWITAAIGRWKGFRHSEKQLPTCAGLPSVDHSTLAKKAREVPFEMMQEILHTLIQRSSRNVRRTLSLPFPIEALDSTTITVGKGRLPWAHFQGNQAGVKLHVRVNTADQALVQVEASPAQAHDSFVAPALLQQPRHVVVQDRGYVNSERFEEMEDQRVFFVVRLRKNMKITHAQTLTHLDEDSPVFRDIAATLQGTSRPFRIVSFHDDRGKAIHVVTNLICVDPEVIADLYRARWQVELFFRWLKQHLNVTTLFGTTENAVYGQLFGACIAYVLIHILYHWKKPRRFQSVSLLDFMRDLWNLQLHPEWVLSLFDLLRASPHLYTNYG